MSIGSTFLIALGLAMDAFAVALTNGMCLYRAGKKEMFLTAAFFGAFQGGMPVIGYFAGQSFRGYMDTWSNWAAPILLGGIGGRMIWEAWKGLKGPEQCESKMALSLKLLLFQGFATSIDALTVGIGFAVIGADLFISALCIAAVTFCCSWAGVCMGKQCGRFLKHKAEIFGGALLILLGLKLFLDG